MGNTGVQGHGLQFYGQVVLVLVQRSRVNAAQQHRAKVHCPDAVVHRLNADTAIHGILVQSPLPAALGKTAEQQVFDAIDPRKDVDGFHPVNVGELVQGRAVLQACTPTGVIELLERSGTTIRGARAVVIGRSEQTPPPARTPLYSCCNFNWLNPARGSA